MALQSLLFSIQYCDTCYLWNKCRFYILFAVKRNNFSCILYNGYLSNWSPLKCVRIRSSPSIYDNVSEQCNTYSGGRMYRVKTIEDLEFIRSLYFQKEFNYFTTGITNTSFWIIRVYLLISRRYKKSTWRHKYWNQIFPLFKQICQSL